MPIPDITHCVAWITYIKKGEDKVAVGIRDKEGNLTRVLELTLEQAQMLGVTLQNCIDDLKKLQKTK